MAKLSVSELLMEKARAGCPAVYLLTPEDSKTRDDIRKVARNISRKLYVWSAGKGIFEVDPKTGDNLSAEPIANSGSAPGALKCMMDLKGPPSKESSKIIVILRLFHKFLENVEVQTALLDIIEAFRKDKRMLIVTAPVRALPPELEKDFLFIESAFPDSVELNGIIDNICTGTKLKDGEKPSDALRKEIISAASGLRSAEAENAICTAFVRGRKEGIPWNPKIIRDEKCQTMRKGGLLEIIETSRDGMALVGGLDLYKAWVARRAKAYSEKAKTFGLPSPRGVLFLGVSGCGKSLAAKATAEEMGLSLLRLDIAALFDRFVGQSEANIRSALQMAETIAPVVLWIDELEKAFAGNRGSLDSGVGARVFGTLLTWMQEKKAPVFVVATANSIEGLPPELLRKGRFDELFRIMLPTFEERKAIFLIHLTRQRPGTPLEKFHLNLDLLADSTEGFSGSEIEEAVIESLYLAFDRQNDLNMVDLGKAIDETRPLSRTMAESLKELEKWCETRTRPASLPETRKKVPNLSQTMVA